MALQVPASETTSEASSVFLRAFRDIHAGIRDRAPELLAGFVIFLVFLAAARIITLITDKAAARSRTRRNLLDAFGRLLSAATVILGLLVASVVIFPAFQPGDLITGLGITSVAVGFAFKDVLQNFFAGILILWRQPFEIGDEIESAGYAGVVEDINTRSTRIRTYDGERAVIPNGEVYTNSILVRTAYPTRRIRVVVGIGYPDSIEDARRAIHELLLRTEGVLHDPGPWVYLDELAESAVNFMVYFWTEATQRNVLATKDRVLTGIKLTLDQAGIDIPYPHTVVVLDDSAAAAGGKVERRRNE